MGSDSQANAEAKPTSKDVGNEPKTNENEATADNSFETQDNSSEDLDINDLKSTNKRLLEESRKYKQKLQETKKQLEERQKKELEEQNKYKELYEQTQEKLNNFSTQLIKEKVNNAVGGKAQKAGCRDMEALMQLGNPDLLQFDEETSEVIGVEQFIEDVKAKRPYLFNSTQKPQINSSAPTGKMTPNRKSLREVVKNKEDLKNIYGELLKKQRRA